jgi:hypothetical protein
MQSLSCHVKTNTYVERVAAKIPLRTDLLLSSSISSMSAILTFRFPKPFRSFLPYAQLATTTVLYLVWTHADRPDATTSRRNTTYNGTRYNRRDMDAREGDT